MASFSTWLHDFRDLLSPRYCAVCGCRLNTTEQKLCSACLLRLPYIPKRDFYDNPVARLFWARIPIERAHSFIVYSHEDASHQLLMQLKYNHRPDLGPWLGRLMARDLMTKGFFETMDCIVAVPLHWRRQLSRGYNQSIELACGIAEVSGLPLLRKHVVRLRNNPQQARNKSAGERMENVENLFLAKSRIPYRHILLVDDVVTTGATLTSCAQAILHSNPDVCFSVLTLAKA